MLSLGLVVLVSQYAAGGDRVPSTAAKSMAAQRYTIRRFLEEAPPLRKIVFAVPGDQFNINGKLGSNFIYYEGACQSSTFYVRQLTNAPGQPEGLHTAGQLVGRSSQGLLWVIDWPVAEGVISAAMQDDPQQVNTHAGHHVETALTRLNSARSLWINLLVPGSLQWLDETRFEAKAKIPPDIRGTNGADGTITGRIVERDNTGRPTKMELSCTGLPKVSKMWQEYSYTEPVGETELPNMIVSCFRSASSFLGGVTVRSTNFLKYVAIGIAPLDAEGYVPGLFLPAAGHSNAPQPYVLFTTNTVTYQADGGAWRRVDIAPPNHGTLHSKWWMLLFASTGILLAYPFLRLAVKRRWK